MFSEIASYIQPVVPQDLAFYSIQYCEILFFGVAKLFPIFPICISEDSLLSITFEKRIFTDFYRIKSEVWKASSLTVKLNSQEINIWTLQQNKYYLVILIENQLFYVI